MIKNLRSIIAVAFMTVCASVSAQSTFNFKNLYESKVNEKTGKYYLGDTKNPDQITVTTTVDDVTLSFITGNCSSAPQYVKYDETSTKATGCVALYGGKPGKDIAAEGSQMKFVKANGNMKEIIFEANKVAGNGIFTASTGELKMDKKTRNYTWTGDASEVTFTIGKRDLAKTSALNFNGVIVNTTITGITNITAEKAQNGVRYNLAGQRVSKDFKGVVIENGKKMIVK